jgi:O-antigen ligase
MRSVVAIFLALGLIAAQIAHGGVLAPFLSLPAYALVGMAGIFSLPGAISGLRGSAPSAVVPILGFAGYLVWRCTVRVPDPVLASADFATVLGCLAAWGAVTSGMNSNGSRFLWLSICGAGAILQVGIALWQMNHSGFGGPWWFSQDLRSLYENRFATRARGSFLNPNQFSWLMNAMALLLLSVGAWGRIRPLWRVIVLYFSAVFVVMSVLSASRGGLISLAGGVFLFAGVSFGAVFFVLRRQRGLILGGAVLALMFCGLAGYFAFSMSWVAQGRLDSLTVPDVRSFFIEHAVRLFQSHPLLGAGPGMYRYAARLYRDPHQPGDAVFAHNDWSQCLAEYGIVGFGLLLLVFICGLSAGICNFTRYIRASEAVGGLTSTRGAFALGGSCALMVFGIHSLTDFNFHIPANALVGAMMLGLATAPGPERSARRVWQSLTGGLSVVGLTGTTAVLVLFLNHEVRPQWETLKAQNDFARSDLDGVLEHTQRALQADPESAIALSLRGKALFEYEAWLESRRTDLPELPTDDDSSAGTDDGSSGTTEAADDKSDSAAADDTEAQPLLSDARRNELWQEALKCYAHAAKIQPMERLSHIGVAKAWVELGAQKRARDSYVQAIRLDPNDSFPWAAYGDFVQDQDQIASAMQIYAIGAGLPDGQYALDQYNSLKEDLNSDTEDTQ